MGNCVLYAFVVDAHSVNQSQVFSQPEAPWLRISFLRIGGKASYLHKSETKVRQRVIGVPVFVKTGCKSYGILELDSKHLTFQTRFAVTVDKSDQRRQERNLVHEFQHSRNKVVNSFRLPEKQDASYELVHIYLILIRQIYEKDSKVPSEYRSITFSILFPFSEGEICPVGGKFPSNFGFSEGSAGLISSLIFLESASCISLSRLASSPCSRGGNG